MLHGTVEPCPVNATWDGGTMPCKRACMAEPCPVNTAWDGGTMPCWNKTCAHGTRRAHMEQDVCTWNKTCAHGTRRVHMEQDVCTWNKTCAHGTRRVHMVQPLLCLSHLFNSAAWLTLISGVLVSLETGLSFSTCSAFVLAAKEMSQNIYHCGLVMYRHGTRCIYSWHKK